MTTKNIRATIATAAAALVLLTNTTIAANNNNLTADVKLVSNTSDQPTFQVNINNRASKKVTVLVKNEEGEVLYREVFSSASYSKKFQVIVYEPGSVKLTYVVTDTKGNSTTFEANNEVKTTEQYVISKV